MILKPGVKIQGIRPELLFALFVADKIYDRYGRVLVVTSLNDGQHSYGSFHYNGLAADLRTRYFEADQLDPIKKDLIEALGPDYDVVLEKDHFHIEFHPKRA